MQHCPLCLPPAARIKRAPFDRSSDCVGEDHWEDETVRKQRRDASGWHYLLQVRGRDAVENVSHTLAT